MEPDSSTPGRASGRSTQGLTGSLPTPSTSSSALELPGTSHTPDPEDTPEQIQVDSVTLVEGTPRVDSKLWKADHAVFRQRKYPNETMELESTARVKHNYTVWYLDTMIQKMRTQTSGGPLAEKMETEKASKISFFDNQRYKYGKVRMASGFGRGTSDRNRRLDWAVIDVYPSRVGENRLPTFEAWESAFGGLNTPNLDTFGALLQPPHPSRLLKDMALGASVWKVGATSGPSHGVYSEYKVKRTLKDDAHVTAIRIDGRTVTVSKYSEQFVIIGHNRPGEVEGRFCGPGDSGAVVFNARGEAVGLLFSGQMPDLSRVGYGLVTPIEEVFADIKACAKDQTEDIRIAMA
ncbi:hypothetical protein NCS52_01186600 [Fusarium sp. LHS14.1]|nr:hypothetical protein NCS52_01186600 [Fusarium sp. LHS14.1]